MHDPARRPSPHLDGRVPIEDVDCTLLTLALALSFDAGELENALASAGLEHDGCGCHAGRGPLTHAHRAAHAGGAFARRLEATLDLLHRPALGRVAAADPAALVDDLDGVDLWRRPDLAGLVWAVARSARPEVACARRRLAALVGLDAVRALAARALDGGPA